MGTRNRLADVLLTLATACAAVLPGICHAPLGEGDIASSFSEVIALAGTSSRTRGDAIVGGFSVNAYHLRVEVYPQSHSLNGTLSVNFTATETLNDVMFFLFPEMDLLEARDDTGTYMDWERDFSSLKVDFSEPLCAGCSTTLLLRFSGIIGEDNVQLHNYVGLEGVYLQNYMLQDLPYNGSWFPWNGVAPLRIEVSVPRDFIALAQGELLGVVHTSTESIYSWDIDCPWLAGSVLLVANQFESFEVDYPGSNVKLFILEDDVERAGNLIPIIQDSLNFYSSKFGDVPCENLRIVETTMFSPDAQGSYCLITFHKNTIGDELLPMETILSHEISHQWWGAGIRFVGQGSAFLSEGFAQYSTYLYDCHSTGSENLILVANDNAVALAEGEFGEEIPIVDTIVDGTQRSVMTRYSKGSISLHMLRYLVEDEMFYSILKEYASTYSLSNATLRNFEDTAQRVSGMNLTRFFEQWLYSVDSLDFQIIEVSSKEIGEGYLNTITVRRSGDAIMPVDIELHYSDGSSELLTKVWDGFNESTVLSLSSEKRVVKAELDPRCWLLDLDRENNVWATRTVDGLFGIALIFVLSIAVVAALVVFLFWRRRKVHSSKC